MDDKVQLAQKTLYRLGQIELIRRQPDVITTWSPSSHHDTHRKAQLMFAVPLPIMWTIPTCHGLR
eukprot:scaffold648690_cov24-Prasinocladus_malaysianus.AAC.1